MSLTAAAVHLLLDRQVPVLMTDSHSQLAGTLADAGWLVEAETLVAQVDRSRDLSFCLNIARQLVRAKLWNYATLGAGHRAGEPPKKTTSPSGSRNSRPNPFAPESIGGAPTSGAGAAAWYDEFRGGSVRILVPGRRMPHAEDPVNVLLNIAQTFLHRQCQLVLHTARLSPMIGLYHKPRAAAPPWPRTSTSRSAT